MVILLSASFLFLIVVSLTIILRQKAGQSRALLPEQLSSPPASFPPARLFADSEYEFALQLKDEAEARFREELKQCASAGDLQVLVDERFPKEPDFYDSVISLLLESCETEDCVFNLARFVAANESLRFTESLGARYLEECKSSTSSVSCSELLHFAALTNDPILYQNACEWVIEEWKRGAFAGVRARDLLGLIEAEQWTISAVARSSGAGFVLKRSLNTFRRELQSENRA